MSNFINLSLSVLLAEFINNDRDFNWLNPLFRYIGGAFMPVIKFYCWSNQIIGYILITPAAHNFECVPNHIWFDDTKLMEQKEGIFIVQKKPNIT